MKQSRAATAAKYTFKALGLILVFGTIAILLWRVFTAGNPKGFTTRDINSPANKASARVKSILKFSICLLNLPKKSKKVSLC